MPTELPGLYWDEEKKRYFPLAMKPKPPIGYVAPNPSQQSGFSRHSISVESAEDEPSRKRRRVEGGTPTFSVLEKLRTSCGSSSRRQKAVHDISASSLSLTCGGAAYPAVSMGEITSICAEDKTAGDFGSCYVMLGDSRGWLYSLSDDTPDRVIKCKTELNIGSSVSAICSWGTRRVAASFGWPCKIFIRDVQPVERWTILSLPGVVCYDVATAVLQDRTLALGAGGKCVLVPDIENGMALQVLPTDSDVLSVSLDNNLVYAGTRNGFVNRFDSRLSQKNHQTILNYRFRRSPNSITHLNAIHQHALLVSTIQGDLEVHDLRFMRESEPLLQLSGHVCSSVTKLGLAIDPSEDFVFAAGQDHRLRGWSLRTGRRIPAQPINSRAAINHWQEAPAEQTRLFDVLFDESVVAMQVATYDTGLCLWAASGGDIYRMPLASSAVVVDR